MEIAETLKRMENLSPAKRAFLLKTLREKAARTTKRIPKRAQQSPVPVSFAQNRLWLLDQLYPGNAAYNVPCAARLRGQLNVTALKQSLNEVVRRHEVLRTTFMVVDEQPMQFIAPELILGLPILDLTAHAEQQSEVARLANEEAAKPFDLAIGPLVRTTLLKLGPEEHVLLVTMHHIICDGWSDSIFINETATVYTALMQGKSSPLTPLPIQYADYAAWQREWLTGEVLEDQLSYWREQLSNAPPVLELPIDHPRVAAQNYRGALAVGLLEREVFEAVGRLMRSEGVTLFMTLLTAFAALLSRYSGQEDIVVGVPSANRTRVETEGLIGFFVNTLALRIDVSGDPSFRELLARAQATTLAAHEHQDIPFDKLVEELKPERSQTNTPFFQVVMDVQNAAAETLEVPGLTLSLLPLEVKAPKFDLLLTLKEQQNETLAATIEYDADLFEAATIERLIGHYNRLLEAAVSEPDLPVSRLPLLSPSERQQLLVDWNQTSAPVPHECLHDLFAAQAERTPDAVAVVGQERELSYRELQQQVNQLAHYLQSLGVGPETVVGVMMKRTPAVVAAVLAVQQAGGAYVGLDPSYPQERLTFMLADSSATVLLTERPLYERVWPGGAASTNVQIVFLDEAREKLSAYPASRPVSRATPENLAYMIYTSGSTGRPKGIAIEHRNAVTMVAWSWQSFTAEALQNVLASTSLCFDMSIYELFVPLTIGTRVIMAENALQLPALKAANEVTLINTVPSAMTELLRLDGVPDSVQVVNLGGEPLPLELVQQTFALTKADEVWNLYGPSEDTTYSTYDIIKRTNCRTPVIGRPLSNSQGYVLDRHLEPTPIGINGELYLGGAGVTRGYIGRPDLTAERYVPDPYSPEPGARMYRTGDLTRYRTDSQLEYLGRMDQQVKLRGYRIELGEIETVLGEHEGVRDCVVVAVGAPGEQQLAAYVVPSEAGNAQLVAELRRHLQERLPSYMVPAWVEELVALPLTPNGKIDRRALPAPGLSREISNEPFIPPRTPIEEFLADLYASLLGVERVGVRDNFFDLGGHSLLATQIVTRVNKAFGVNVGLRDFFERSAAFELAECVEQQMREKTGRKLPPVERVARDGALPLSFAQQRLWFLHQLEPSSTLYNIPMAVRLEGTLDIAVLNRAVSEVVRRHEVLRTNFRVVEGRPVQVISAPAMLELPLLDLSGKDSAARESEVMRLVNEEVQKPFDIFQDSLLRVKVLRLTPHEHVVLFTIHHIISDGWSIEVLVHEVARLYGAFVVGDSSPLEELPIQYVDYAAWQRSWLQGEALDEQVSYWVRQLEGAPPVLTLPTDYPRPSVQTYRGAKQNIELSTELSASLKALSREEGVTLFMTLLAAWQVLLARHAGQESISVGTPIAGRTSAEFEELIGFFVNTLILRTDLSGDPTFEELLQRVKETALGGYMNQDIPFEKLVEALQPERTLQHSALFQVVFMLQNAPTKTLQMPGVTMTAVDPEIRTAIVDLKLAVSDVGSKLIGELEYNADLFAPETMERLLGQWRELLSAVVAAPATRLSELPLMGVEEEQELAAWNATAGEYELNACLHQLVEQQAARTPERIAVGFEGKELSYAELNRRANQLARHLRRLGVGPETKVGVLLERSMELVVGLLGILKAGGAYVPLDPQYPEERLRFMLADSGATVLLTSGEFTVSPDPGGHGVPPLQVVHMERVWEQLATESGENLESSDVDVANLAYVIYTSGSTGQPKGVCISHRAICNRLQWMQTELPLTATDCVLQKTSISFDASVWELFVPLLAGARVQLAAVGGEKDSSYLVQAVQTHQVTVLQLVPSMLRVWLEEPGVPECVSLRRLYCGGEALSAELAARCYERLPGVELHNLYGPTETAIDATHGECAREETGNGGLMSIGRALTNVTVYVLDERLRQEPVGVTGELYIGGAGVARGYLGRVELTAERFVPDALGQEAGGRLYRTGDTGRRLRDGRLEYVGRGDEQVKVRGYRIELGEIEAALSVHEGVAECVVVAREEADGHKRLLAYVVPKQPLATNGQLHKLPNNLEVTYLNRNEADVIYREIFEDQTYSKYGITFNDGDCIFDVGANIGLFTLFVHGKCRAPRVYAFEPVPMTFDKLRSNIALYGLDVQLFECGLSRESKETDVTFYPNWSGMSGAYANAKEDEEITRAYLNNLSRQVVLPSDEIGEILEGRFKGETVRCRMRTLSEVIREQGIERIDLLKVDVERSELDVLLGIDDDDWSRIGQVVLEVHDRDGQLETIRTLLARHNFDVFVEQDKLLENTELYNVYAVKRTWASQRAQNGATGNGWLLPKAKSLSPDDLRSALEHNLPEYMIPAAFVMLEKLPRSPNGKVDRRALPAPGEMQPVDDETFAAPQTEIQNVLAGIWAELLGVEKVGIHSNFFRLGGDSIISLQLVARARNAGVKFTTRQLFQHQTIAELSAVATLIADSRSTVANAPAGPTPLTPAQHAFFEHEPLNPHHFNQALLFEVRRPLDEQLLKRAVASLAQHHDALRLRFTKNGCWKAHTVASAEGGVSFTRIDLSSTLESERKQVIETEAARAQGSLSITDGPLMRVVLFDPGAEGVARLLLFAHHLVVDGVSWRILLQDLETAYEQLSHGQEVSLPPGTTSFKQWSENLRDHAQSATLRDELDYWRSLPFEHVKKLPVEAAGENLVAQMRVHSAALNEEETRALLREVPGAYRTQINDALLTALAQTLGEWTSSRHVLVELEGHGREELVAGVDVSRTIGWFTSLYPVVLEMPFESTPGSALKSIKEQLRHVPNRGIGYGLLRYLSGDEEVAKQIRELPKAEVSFNYLGQFDNVLPEDTAFAAAAEWSGAPFGLDEKRWHLLDVSGSVESGRLKIEWTYNVEVHSAETIEKLSSRYLDALRRIIAHCQSTDSQGFTPSDFPLAQLDQQTLDTIFAGDSRIEDIYTLSPLQHGLLFHALRAPAKETYLQQMTCTLHGDLNGQAFRRAWQSLFDRHAILRTSFVWQGVDEPLQIVRRGLDLSWEEQDWRGLPAEEKEEKIAAYLKADRARGFDLSGEQLMRLSLIRLDEQVYQFTWSIHHLLMDGWSGPVLIKEVIALYEALLRGKPLSLPVARPFRDYVEWLTQQDLSAAENYWRNNLRGFNAPTRLKLERTEQTDSPAIHERQDLVLTREETLSLQDFARSQQLTVNTLIQASWALVLSHHSDQLDVVFGTVVSGRPEDLEGVESMVGPFINTLPVRVQIDDAAVTQHWLRELQSQQVEMRQYEHSPLVKVQGWSNVPRGVPLFDSFLNFLNYPKLDTQGNWSGTLAVSDFRTSERSSYALTVDASIGSLLTLEITADGRRFDQTAVTRLLHDWREILHLLVTNSEKTLDSLLSKLEDAEKRRRGQRLKQIRRRAAN